MIMEKKKKKINEASPSNSFWGWKGRKALSGRYQKEFRMVLNEKDTTAVEWK